MACNALAVCPTTPQPSFAFPPISVHFCLPEPTRGQAVKGMSVRDFDDVFLQ
jgi:hypothetical protein